MNPDKTFATALNLLTGKPPTPADVEKARRRVADLQQSIPSLAFRAHLGACLDAAANFRDESKRLPQADYLNLLSGLNTQGFILSSELLALRMMPSLRDGEPQALLQSLPTPKAVEAWSKAAAIKKQDLQAWILENPARALETAGLDWFFQKGDPAKSRPLLDLLLSGTPRPAHLPTSNTVLASALQKDAKGILLCAALKAYYNDEARKIALCQVITGAPRLLAFISDLLPALLQNRQVASNIPPFARLLFGSSVATAGLQRRYVSAAMARFATAILLQSTITPHAQQTLDELVTEAARLANLTLDPGQKKHTWLLSNMAGEEEAPQGEVLLTPSGARRVAIAFEDLEKGIPAAEVLIMLAKSLGLVPFGDPASTTSFDPLAHEDVNGGLLPGDSVLIVSRGWTLAGETVIRAKVVQAK